VAKTWPSGEDGSCAVVGTDALTISGACLPGDPPSVKTCYLDGDTAAMAPTPMSDSAGELLDQVLNPLLDDFQQSFERGLVLMAHTPDRVLAPSAREALVQRLRQALAELQAARALRAAAPAPMALDMATISPWHSLVLEVWSLSSALRHAGVKTELI
jgi:hypothetical protein